jgi:FlaA1/EpsC-like NDP-sugar epimerase
LIPLLCNRTVVFHFLGLFRVLSRYAGVTELRRVIGATTLTSAGLYALSWIPIFHLPRSVYVVEWLGAIVSIGGLHLAVRIVSEWHRSKKAGTRTLIVGAGDTAESLLRDVQRTLDGRWQVVGLLDDDPMKAGILVHGVPVLGPIDEPTLAKAIARSGVGLVVIADARLHGAHTREITRLCRRLHVQLKIIPSVPERMEGDATVSSLRDVEIHDLLRREPVRLDATAVSQFLQGKCVLITGAGGSIGSELARQTLRFSPAQLVLLDHDENALFFVERELRSAHPDSVVHPLMADITDRARVNEIFRRFRPDVIFHAAAHKHVPMMECNPCEAVKNNIFGSTVLYEAADLFHAGAFVLISTDKAVNPTSVMGATKRVAEMVLQVRSQSSTTRFAAVRFGNVLDSAGSVLPLFRDQIAKGKPVTVTHPEVTRYFMTIPEATQLVLQAGALGGTGQIFVLDMGQPIRIVDLARDFIELSGLRPDVDIEIRFTGLRPGEKLYEELLLDGEQYDQTPHPKIKVGHVKPPRPGFVERLSALHAAAIAGDEAEVRRFLAALVPEATLQRLPPASVLQNDKPRVDALTEISISANDLAVELPLHEAEAPPPGYAATR